MKLSNYFKNLALCAALVASLQANALVSPFTGGATLALSGIISVGAGYIAITSDTGYGRDAYYQVFGGLALEAIGIIMLDGENGQNIIFQEITHENLLNIGLTEDEAKAYNDNLEELTTALKVVSSNLMKDSTREDSAQEWQEQEDILGADSINAARKVLQFNMKK